MTMLERVKNLTEKECIVDVLRKELADNKCKNCGKCTFGRTVESAPSGMRAQRSWKW